MDVKSCGINGNLQLLQIEFTDGLIADIPRVKEKLATLVLSISINKYFHIFKVLSVLPLKIVSDFFE